MYNSRALFLLPLLLHLVVALVSAQRSESKWLTLAGDEPIVIARGGVSGLFPDSSIGAYALALMTSLTNVVLWCDVQLTKDAVGICFGDYRMDNASNIGLYFPKGTKTYNVNGVLTTAYFPIDFTSKDLSAVSLLQGNYARSNRFDGNQYAILTVENVKDAMHSTPAGLWLNFEHPAFYAEHRLNMRDYVLSVSRKVIVNYISSPEVAFLNSIKSRFSLRVTQLVFRFRGQNETEISTNQTYGSLLKNLTFIKTFATGILVPKYYIWPVDAKNYLEPHTTLVSDAHKAGLKIFASDFANDVPVSYNYSYDPVAEYLSFIDNGDFSVDGVLTDFPITPSEAIGCFAHVGKNATVQAKPLVISKCGASGEYPGCTDLAYEKAIADGVDVLDCPVQLSKDGIPFCSSSINLIDSTTIAQSSYSNLTMSIPEIKAGTGIFTFSLTWSEIKALTPSIANPFSKYTLLRNPLYKNAGQYLTLSEFLNLTKNTSSLSGILIGIEHAAYLAEEQKLSVTDAVLGALNKASFSNQTKMKVMIQSSNSSVLMKLKGKSSYELVYKIDENIGDAPDSTVERIKKFANSVVVSKDSVFPVTEFFLSGATEVVTKLQSFKLPVFVETFNNEFVSQPWDFFSDATVEINSYVAGVVSVDGVITDFPHTAARYKRSPCLGMGSKTPQYMNPVEPGSLIGAIGARSFLPPAEAPNPVFTVSDLTEPPLPSVSDAPATSPGGSQAATPPRPNGQPEISASFFLLSSAVLLAALFLL